AIVIVAASCLRSRSRPMTSRARHQRERADHLDHQLDLDANIEVDGPSPASSPVCGSVAAIQHAAKIVVGMPRFTDNTLCLGSVCAAKSGGVEKEKDFARQHRRCCRI